MKTATPYLTASIMAMKQKCALLHKIMTDFKLLLEERKEVIREDRRRDILRHGYVFASLTILICLLYIYFSVPKTGNGIVYVLISLIPVIMFTLGIFVRDTSNAYSKKRDEALCAREMTPGQYKKDTTWKIKVITFLCERNVVQLLHEQDYLLGKFFMGHSITLKMLFQVPLENHSREQTVLATIALKMREIEKYLAREKIAQHIDC